jgi:hypothetical protein
VRHVWEQSEDDKISKETHEELDDASDKISLEECCVLNELKPKQLSIKPKICKKSAAETECEAWVEYIYGNASKPNHRAPKTLISQSRSEGAANKPLVQGKCDETHVNIFLDSGAETNVMDADFYYKICEKNREIKLTPTNQIIRCANGTKMRPLGITFVRLSFGNVDTVAKFTVVEKLFPRIIVGMRTMKGVGLILEPSKDCARIGHSRLPFLSKVVAPSVYYEQGNVKRSALRVRNGLEM